MGLKLQWCVDHADAKTNIGEVWSLGQVDLEHHVCLRTERTFWRRHPAHSPPSPVTLKPIASSAPLSNVFCSKQYPPRRPSTIFSWIEARSSLTGRRSNGSKPSKGIALTWAA